MFLKNKTLFQALLIFFLLILTFVAWKFVGRHKKALERFKRKLPPPVVTVKEVYPRSIPIIIKSWGTVRPVKKVILSSEISGRVIYISPRFLKGSVLKKGETILKLDSSDYQIALEIAKKQVKIAQNKLVITKQEAKQSVYEWKLMHPDKEPPFMVSKKPHLEMATATLDEAKAKLKKAELDLKRTVLKVPFNSIVVQKKVDRGSYITPGTSIGEIAGIDEAEVYVPISLDDARWINIPGYTTPSNSRGSKATLWIKLGEKKVVKRGEVVRSEGILDENTRTIKIVVRVKKPYNSYPSFAFGSFVTVIIKGKVIEKGFEIPVQAIHEGSKVWVVRNKRLWIKKITVLRYIGDTAIVSIGLKPKDKIIISPLPHVKNGMKVRIQKTK